MGNSGRVKGLEAIHTGVEPSHNIFDAIRLEWKRWRVMTVAQWSYIRSIPHGYKNGSGKDGEYGEHFPSAIRLGNPLLSSSASKVVTIHFEASPPCHLVLVGMQCQNRCVAHWFHPSIPVPPILGPPSGRGRVMGVENVEFFFFLIIKICNPAS